MEKLAGDGGGFEPINRVTSPNFGGGKMGFIDQEEKIIK